MQELEVNIVLFCNNLPFVLYTGGGWERIYSGSLRFKTNINFRFCEQNFTFFVLSKLCFSIQFCSGDIQFCLSKAIKFRFSVLEMQLARVALGKLLMAWAYGHAASTTWYGVVTRDGTR